METIFAENQDHVMEDNLTTTGAQDLEKIREENLQAQEVNVMDNFLELDSRTGLENVKSNEWATSKGSPPTRSPLRPCNTNHAKHSNQTNLPGSTKPQAHSKAYLSRSSSTQTHKENLDTSTKSTGAGMGPSQQQRPSPYHQHRVTGLSRAFSPWHPNNPPMDNLGGSQPLEVEPPPPHTRLSEPERVMQQGSEHVSQPGATHDDERRTAITSTNATSPGHAAYESY